MSSWAEGQACKLDYPIYVRLFSDDDREQATKVAAEVQNLLRADNDLSLYNFYVTQDDSNATIAMDALHSVQHTSYETVEHREHHLTVSIKEDLNVKATEASLWSWVPLLEVRHSPGKSADPATLAPFISQEIRKIFREEQGTISSMVDETAFTTHRPAGQLSPEARATLDGKKTRAFKYASDYHLTFSMFTSSATPSSWDIEGALENTINPLIARFSSISKFTVDTQVQLYASFSPSIAGPLYDESTREWQLQRSDLSGFINAAEWPLSPGIGAGPTINFVLFVPSKDQSPLVIAETGGNSWLIPQWGGVQILNPSGKQPERLSASDLEPVMLTFADQLSSLLGLPSSPPSLALRISSLTRERATSIIISASSTLGALARLTLKLKSIAIPESVAKSVDQTIHHLDQACRGLQSGQYHEALENARTAEEEAEQAFFEPSMVGQVYFPDEHKVAVYVPLLGPMAVPLIMALAKELREFIKKLREKRSGKAKDE
ncbi:GPI transamidase component [Saxophila tyrrhenica]|uniref:GPI transamidase component n=1 Tax=Saxophila tyrrhenica TaxID=1690608 RepID=A0AAV9PEL1_9PEZI|nr:GPI transamidase component [Saxophila tyrrhenica]